MNGGPRLVVVGAGVSGLAAARRLVALRPDAAVTVLESSDRIGGKLYRRQVGGAWVDVGAEAMLARRPETRAALADAGVESEVIAPSTTSASLVRDRRRVPMPARTMLGIPTDLESLASSGVLDPGTVERIRAEGEQTGQPPLTADVAVGELVARRFGDDVVDRLVDPLLGGVYAGRARELSLAATIPAVYARLAEDGGSLLAAARALMPAPGAPPSGPVFASLVGGLARLPEAMADDDRFEVRLNCAVRSVRRTPTGWELEAGSAADPQWLTADGLVLAVPASKAARLLTGVAPAAAAELSGITSAGMAIVTLAFAGPVGLPAGSGMLIPAVEGVATKAMTFSSQKWPGVGDDGGVVLMRGSLGRAGDERTLQRDDAELSAQVRTDLAGLTGVTATPVDVHVQRWGAGLPQYAPGHLDLIARVRASVAAAGPLALAGAALDGVGVPACIGSGLRAADEVVAALDGAALDGTARHELAPVTGTGHDGRQ